jgi:hypothetical protein
VQLLFVDLTLDLFDFALVLHGEVF